MNCPHCGADIEKEVNDYIGDAIPCLDFIFVCPKCDKALGVKTGKCNAKP